jgi:hypothetical protein
MNVKNKEKIMSGRIKKNIFYGNKEKSEINITFSNMPEDALKSLSIVGITNTQQYNDSENYKLQYNNHINHYMLFALYNLFIFTSFISVVTVAIRDYGFLFLGKFKDQLGTVVPGFVTFEFAAAIFTYIIFIMYLRNIRVDVYDYFIKPYKLEVVRIADGE